MFFKNDKLLKFSIRKLNVGIVSAIIGMSLLFGGAQSVNASDGASPVTIQFEYIDDSELSEHEKGLLSNELSHQKVGEYQTYYMVYRPHRLAQTLPKTGTAYSQYLTFGGLLLIGTALTKKRSRRIVTSILLIVAMGGNAVQALTHIQLSDYNRQVTLRVGDDLPDMRIAIPGYQFLGYLPGNPRLSAKDNPQLLAPSSEATSEPPVSVADTSEAVSSPESSELPSDSLGTSGLPSSDVSSPSGEDTPEPPVSVSDTSEAVSSPESSELPSDSLDMSDLPSSAVSSPSGEATSEPPVSVSDTSEAVSSPESSELPSDSLDMSDLPSSAVSSPLSEDTSEPPVSVADISEAVSSPESSELPSDSLGTSDLPSSDISSPSGKDTSDVVSLPESSDVPSDSLDMSDLPSSDVSSPSSEATSEPPVSVADTLEDVSSPESSELDAVTELSEPSTVVSEETAKTETILTSDSDNVSGEVATEVGTDANNIEEVLHDAEELAIVSSELKAVIAKVEQLASTKYTLSSWQRLEQQLRQAQALLLSQGETQDKLRQQLTDLQAAFDSLVAVKRKPSFTHHIHQDAMAKAITIAYTLNDSDQAFKSGKIELYLDNQLIDSQALASGSHSFLMAIPHYDTNYQLKISYEYSLGEQLDKEILPADTVCLQLKKIALKDIDEVKLYLYQEGQLSQQAFLDDSHASPQAYFVTVSSERFKDILLPVKAIEKTTNEGREAYKILCELPELVQANPQQAAAYIDGFTFYIDKKPTESNVFTDFVSLVKAIEANPSGNYVLGANLQASDLKRPITQKSYITKTFSGSLVGSYQGKRYRIKGLDAPLFAKVENATIQDVTLTDVNINNREVEVGTIAPWIINSTVLDTIVEGNIVAQRKIGGLAYMNDKSLFERTAFIGNITARTTDSESFVGGIAGALSRGTIKDSYVDATIVSHYDSPQARVGGIVGFTNGTSSKDSSGFNVINVYTTGQVRGAGSRSVTGGIVGSTEGTDQGRIRQAISDMKVENGNAVYGYLAIQTDRLQDLKTTATETLQNQPSVHAISQDLAQEQLKKLSIFNLTQSMSSHYLSTDYTQLPTAQGDRALAYRNMEKLLPFYNKEILVHYGNLLAPTDNLYLKELVSVLPFVDDKEIIDVVSHKTQLNGLLLYYADGSKEKVSLRYQSDFGQTAISEYQIGDGKLLYTPNQWLYDYQDIIDAVKKDLQEVDYYADTTLLALGIPTQTEQKRREYMDKLYLSEAFTEQQQAIEGQLRKILASDKIFNANQPLLKQYTIDYIKKNKEKLLLGLSYMQRWYNIRFGSMSLQDIATFRQDFFGKQVNTLEWLVALADAGYSHLSPTNNVSSYGRNLAPNTGKASLFDYLTANRQLWTTFADDNEWFKASTTAYIVETPSQEAPERDVRIYTRLTSNSDERNGVLPLLTAREGIFIISNMATISYSMFARYMDMSLKDTNPAKYQEERQKVIAMIEKTAKMQGDYFDVWYRIAPENVKQRLFKAMPVWDGYNARGKWLPKYGSQANEAIRDFFGPIGERSNVTNNGFGAYADGAKVFYVHNGVLTDYGMSVFTHEVTHNNDGGIYLGGYGRRQGMGAESFALGLLQSESYGGHTVEFLTLNLAFDHQEQADSTNRYVNVSPERFKTAQDTQTYLHGLFDVIYLLDYAEAQAVLKQEKTKVRDWFGAFENVYDNPNHPTDKGHAVDRVRPFTMDDANKVKTWQDLIDLNAVSLKGLNNDKARYDRNNYYTSATFTANFSALSNPYGSPGGLTFRRRAFELWAAKGYEGGFIPYASNQLLNKSTLLTDDLIFKSIFKDDSYQTWQEFKKAMFQERIDKIASLAPITFNYFKEDRHITQFSQIQELMDWAVQKDIEVARITTSGRASHVHLLKMAILNAYLRQTDDFRQSIFVEKSSANQ